jgi:hypothetical protein
MNFGKYAVLNTSRHHFELEPDWWWDIKPISSEEELDMTKFMSTNRYYTTRDGVRHEHPATWVEIAYREIALAFGGTNIPKDPKDPDVPVLAENAKVSDVENVLRKMPQEMVNEIWRAVGEANPTWGPGLIIKQKDSESKSTPKEETGS